MNIIQYNKIRKIKEHYDFEDQKNMMVEECSELIQAVTKLKRSSDTKKTSEAFVNFVEEVADVLIVAEQMKMYIGEGAVDIAIDMKLNRTIERMSEECEDHAEASDESDC